MTTDRVQMELAAKAAGIELRFSAGFEDDLSPRTWPALGLWNPITDDGDALRLAVKAGIWIHPGEQDEYVEAVGVSAVYEPPGNDREAATRRAIVRAAAEIGRSMP